MTPISSYEPQPGDEKATLLFPPAVGVARPKRRCTLEAEAIGQAIEPRVVIPLELQRPRPAKFKRSAVPFQIWKAPPPPVSPARAKGAASFLAEFVRHCIRSAGWLSSARLRPSH